MSRRAGSITIKGPPELAIMREAGSVVARALAKLGENIRPGVSTQELDQIAEQVIRESGAVPSFKGYNGFPGSICTSINEEVVHGLPSAARVLVEGDIISLDVGAIVDGWHGDAAVTLPVGKTSPVALRLLDVTRESLRRGIARARAGRHVSDISWAIQSYVESRGYSVVRQYVGHGIGSSMHEAPDIPNYGPPGQGAKLREGMTFALEPMVNIGTFETTVLSDNWTVVTADRKLSAHFEHTVAVTRGEPLILTAP